MSITALHPAASEAPAADSDRPEAAPSRRARPLTEGEQQVVLAVAVLAAGLGLIGFANSYPDALTRERARLLALTDLQDPYGPLAWRWRAPRRTRALYRLGELAPAVTTPALTSATGDDRSASPADTPAQARPRPTTRRKRA